ncbi:putative ABC transporter periplasmic binding protein [Bradyrhizobium oligotrophicum S58]|uniref:Putative ABC transporter periplasmic binding protein n=1 Tax=Bradyrhizobium oligotrophicum S58 TaxID=1245469 RepID=M4Z324_9BRAD|nr:ABC transporter substrate-binding protein [Bradyrhizobium oligotrophicum]BAM87152.1 putative ABC transporter periplasmic binding protein [Bradyrhizobium oligotrophicum S58]
MVSRRSFLKGSAGAALLMSAAPARLMAAEARKIRFGVGLKALNATVINCVIGEALGYNAQEGFSLDVQALGTNANVQVATDRGSVAIGVGVPSTALPLLAKGEWGGAKMFYQYTYPYKWDIAVPPGSALKSYTDLKGKKIGVSDFGATEYPVTKNVLKALGLDPDKDVSWVAVGNGTPAGVALQRGVIDALAYFDTGFGQIEAAGIELSYLPRPTTIPMVGGQFLMAMPATFEKDRDLLIGFGRSVCKASQFLLANPAAGAKAFLKLYPETAPRGASEDEAVKAVLQSISRRIKLYAPPYANTKMGAINEQEFRTEAAMNGLDLKDYAALYTNELIDKINNFDAVKVKAEAAAYKG